MPARRLTLAFVATAVAATALSAILVNLAIDARFEAYLESQRQAREQQLVDVLAADYLRPVVYRIPAPLCPEPENGQHERGRQAEQRAGPARGRNRDVHTHRAAPARFSGAR